MTTRPILSLVLVLVLGLLAVGELQVAAQTVPLHVAAAEGKVSIRAECIGGATGNRLKVYVQKKVEGELRLTVSPGTIFAAEGANVQRLAVVRLKGKLASGNRYYRGSVIVLSDNQTHGYLMQTICMDYHRRSASAGQRYVLRGLDARCSRILSAQKDAALWACQSAAWMDRAGVAASELRRRYRVRSEDLETARAMLAGAERAGIASLDRLSISADARIAAAGVYSPDPKVRAAAYARVQKMVKNDRQQLAALLDANVVRSGKLPTRQELLAANTLENLIPSGMQLPELRIRDTVDDLLKLVGSRAESAPAGDRRPRLRRVRLLAPLKGLKSSRPLLRVAAAKSLARIKDPLAVDALILSLGDSNAAVRSAAAAGLKKLSDQDFGEDQKQWSKWWETAHDTFASEQSP